MSEDQQIAIRLFMQRAQAIRTDWQERVKGENRAKRHAARRALRGTEVASSWSEAADDWLRRTAYKFLKGYVRRGGEAIIVKAFGAARRKKAGRHSLEGQLFKQGLLALFPDEGGPQRQTRSDWGDEMQYAYDHMVPSRYLNAFIKLAGGARLIRKKVAAKHVEPGYRHRGYSDSQRATERGRKADPKVRPKPRAKVNHKPRLKR